ncbi:30S ribosomal protein S9 [Acidianus manzaensis]|uniref:Small ribosomal subunit protein uS9 n=1 Tax=Acidianus manzaensis TaxID=282676 RepID=A0A1W6JZV2_9CREN|nr:30S ribosomal protein S9 [Acidianus manzaensis]ARM75755.1 30S ribosomal protein S9 [Acidianus manzaensis]
MENNQSNQVIITSASRKTASARCYLYPGKGRVFINDIPVELIPIEMVRLKIMEPLLLAGDSIISKIDARVYATGGGIMGQADAARMAIAKAIVKYFNNPEIKELYKQYDRTMLAGDPRQTESEKWMRYSARRWRQKAYR